MSIQVMIVDDEALARDELKYLIAKNPAFTVCAEAESGIDALKKNMELQPDVIFLDIHMPDLDGLLLAKQWKQQKRSPMVIFATAYDEHAVEAFETRAFDYILKPFQEKRVMQTLESIVEQKEPARKASGFASYHPADAPGEDGKVNKLIVEEGDEIFLVCPGDIVFVSREERKVYIHTKTRKYRSTYTLKELENKLSKFGMFRCHRSFIVNLERIQAMLPWVNGAYNLRMDDRNRTEVPVSRNYVKELKERLQM